jgi:polyketide biosynthesis 3-hydroxy-3-methylglutaryl-CoA synthase-like enzyme PksG
MKRAGIEAIGVYAGRTMLDVGRLAEARGLDTARFRNLLMRRKSVALPVEDPVSFAVNAARPIVDRLSAAERAAIRLLVVGTESGIDFGKAMSSYVQHHLGLSRNCRTFEIKHACFGGTAALQTAADFVRGGGAPPDARALVIATDVARPIPRTYVEPSQGAAAVAMLVGPAPRVLELEPNPGSYAFEVMDTCRPTPDFETGDADLSLLSYLDCVRGAFADYRTQSGGAADFRDDFDGLAFHTPFGGMVKGAHRTMMRDLKRLPPAEIEADFERRVLPSLAHCAEVGNIYSGSVFLALCGALEALVARSNGAAATRQPPRVGLFSYGSGCCSEFYAGLVQAGAGAALAEAAIGRHLGERRELTMPEYERLLELNRRAAFGVEAMDVDPSEIGPIYGDAMAGTGLLVLRRIRGFHREYDRA